MAASSNPSLRGVAKRISVFNHKGGVGKTTLTVNIAASLAALGKRVLLVDSDAQCNLSSYLVESPVFDDVLDKSETDEGQTIWTALKPIADATGDIRVIDPIERLPNLFLLYGDIRLSQFEEELTGFWNETLSRKPKGFRGTTALSSLVTAVSSKFGIDYVFYDCGPNIGPLNRVILLDCDHFIVPAALDEFSVRALSTLGFTLDTWIRTWRTIADLAPAGVYLLPGKPHFLGYVIHRFRLYGGQISSGQAAYLPRFERQIFSEVVDVLRKIDPHLASGSLTDNLLGEVKDFASLAAMSQAQGVPLAQVRGGNANLKLEANQVFTLIAERIAARV